MARTLFLSNLPALRGVNPAAAAPWVAALFTVAVSYSLATLSWRLLPAAPVSAVSAAPRPAAATRAVATRPRLDNVADLHLFGEVAGFAPKVEPSAVEAPETRLNLTLRGVFAAADPGLAFAIIADGTGDEQRYRPGATLPGGALLREVLPDRVILERNERFETLRLPKESARGAEIGAAQPESGAVVGDAGIGARLSEVREKILSDPQEALKLVQVQPVVEGGKLTGYRLNPRGERQLFREAGLRPGDVLTSVNGVPLDDPTKLGEVIDQLTTAGQVTLAVERGGRQQTIVIPMGQ